jgi:hypothetical protein
MTYTFKLSRRLASLRSLAWVAAILLAAGCADDSTAPSATGEDLDPALATSDPVVRVDLIPAQVSCQAGAQVNLTAKPYRASGAFASGRRIIFRVRDTTRATVSVTGAQTATLRCRASGRTWALADIDRRHDSSSVAVGTGTSEPTPPTSPSPTPPPPTTSDLPLPFGLMHTPMDEYSSRWTGALYVADARYLSARLSRAEDVGMKLVVAMAATSQSKNADGTFSLARWKQQVDRYRSMSLSRYISNKTLYVHYLIDEPACVACWGGKPIPWSTVEEMARYSKSIWPSLPTAARVDPSKLAAATFRWTYLDAGWAQYNTRKGDLQDYLDRELAVAKQEGLGLVAGMNLLDGSGSNTAPMTPTQLKQFGTIIASNPSVCGLVGWRHDPAYLRQSGVMAAFDAIADVARRRRSASCVVS